MIERERTFLVRRIPGELGEPTAIRQGYVALDGDRSLRVREKGSALILTVKGGSGRARTEVELDLDRERFDALWALTEGRRVAKVRHEVALGALTAELDAFSGALSGLRLVEVEFDDDAQSDAFEPPDWFGAEVTDDERYTNAWLARHGLPD